MERKYFYGLLAGGILGFGLSGSLVAEPVPFSGFFVNGDLGFSTGGAQYTETITTPVPADSGVVGKTKINTSGAIGALAMGFGHTFSNNLHLGGDIHGGLSGAKGNYKTESRAVDSDVKLKMTNFLGMHLQPGFVVGKQTAALLHFIVGVDSAKWKLNASSDITNGRSVNEAQSINKRLMGFTYGIGTKILVSPGLAVGLKVTHTNYKALPAAEHKKAVPNKLTYSVKPQENRAMISVTKFFNS